MISLFYVSIVYVFHICIQKAWTFVRFIWLFEDSGLPNLLKFTHGKLTLVTRACINRTWVNWCFESVQFSNNQVWAYNAILNMSGNSYALRFSYACICLIKKSCRCLFISCCKDTTFSQYMQVNTHKTCIFQKIHYFCSVKLPIFDEISFCWHSHR